MGSLINIFINEASNFVSKVYNWVISIFRNDDIIANNNNDLPPYFYDIYYHFKFLEKNRNLHGITVEKFNYPDSFYLTVPDTSYKIKISKIDDNVFTSIYFDGQLSDFIYLGYVNGYLKHSSIASLENEIYMLTLRIRTIDV